MDNDSTTTTARREAAHALQAGLLELSGALAASAAAVLVLRRARPAAGTPSALPGPAAPTPASSLPASREARPLGHRWASWAGWRCAA